VSVAAPRAGEVGYDEAAPGYSWAADDEVVLGYQQAGYDDDQAAPGWSDSELPGGYSWMTDDSPGAADWPVTGFPSPASTVSNAIRGFAPAPDEPLPVYPPGPFAAWNRGAAERGEPGAQDRTDQPRPRQALAAATITPDEFDTDYSLPAIKDPIPGGTGTGTGATRPAAGGRPRTQAGRRAAASGRSASSRRAGGGGSGRSARAGAGRSRSRSRHLPVWLAIGGAVVIVAAVVVVLVATSVGNPPASAGKSTNAPHKTNATPTPPAGKWEYIGSRVTDPTPLSLRELFPASFVTGGVYYHVTITRRGHDCHTALIGGALQAAVRKANCTQDLRASYVSRIENAMATIGVFNLADATGAASAALHAGRSQFVAQLAAKNGVTSKIGQGTGIEEALVKGHYLVLVYAENINLAAPKTNWQRRHLTIFMNTLIAQTINASLSYRMVDGAAPSPSSSS
jgi:hypothetical protein